MKDSRSVRGLFLGGAQFVRVMAQKKEFGNIVPPPLKTPFFEKLLIVFKPAEPG